MPTTPIPAFPFTVNLAPNLLQANMYGGAGLDVVFNSGLITFLGPNGSGKTTALKALRTRLRELHGNNVVRYISAGRMGAIEAFRSDMNGVGMNDPNETYTGSQGSIGSRKQSETVTGDFLALEERSDIKLKVEARLQGIFGKTIILNWAQNGLRIHFKSIKAGSTSYGAGSEASGLTQMVAILAALYDDEIKFLLIDEPEVSLHPQLQSFILKEIKNLAGDPNIAGKKAIVLSTHSPLMLLLKKTNDLPSIIFFKDVPEIPIQINAADPILIDPTIVSLIIRLNELYKIALFSKSVFLSEGVSDEIIVSTLIDRIDEYFSSNGNQLVSIDGKEQLIVAHKLFTLIGKKVCMMGDLDVLDNGQLATYLDTKAIPGLVLNGFANLQSMYNDADTDLVTIITGHWAEISAQAMTHRYWRGRNFALEQKRCALAFLLNANPAAIAAIGHGVDWQRIITKFSALLDNFDKAGLVLIRKGTIEDCYINPTIPANSSKPIAASFESPYLITAPIGDIATSYADTVKAIDYIKQSPSVDEASLLRSKLGSVIGQILANINSDTSNQNIQTIIDGTDKGLSNIFRITKDMVGLVAELKIEILSPLFSGHPNPIIYLQTDRIEDLQNKLPSQ